MSRRTTELSWLRKMTEDVGNDDDGVGGAGDGDGDDAGLVVQVEAGAGVGTAMDEGISVRLLRCASWVCVCVCVFIDVVLVCECVYLGWRRRRRRSQSCCNIMHAPPTSPRWCCCRCNDARPRPQTHAIHSTLCVRYFPSDSHEDSKEMKAKTNQKKRRKFSS